MEAWIWLIVALATLVVEFATMGQLVSIWFSVGALAAYLVSFLNPGFGIELVVFIGVSLLAFAALRPFALKYLTPKPTNTNADRLIGKRTKLVEEIYPDKWGAVILEGIRWSCLDEKRQGIPKDSLVEVVAFEGAKAVVRQVS